MSAGAPDGRVVIGGAGGFMGHALANRARRAGREVVTVGRAGSDLTWDDPDGLARAVDGASLVLGLAGKSVDCRYTPPNRAEIIRSRVATTAAIAEAIRRAAAPPALWVNSSTATIYRHAMDRPQTEREGELGSGFSVDVARAWEAELFRDELPATRRVAMRSAIVLGSGGVLPVLRTLARAGLGGSAWDGPWPVSAARRAAGTAHDPGSRRGEQRFSWIHLGDIARIIDFLETRPDIEGPVNASSPHPVTNRRLMALVRRHERALVGPPLQRWMLELGAVALRTETELILKSRWVVPQRLLEAGYRFHHPRLDGAIGSIVAAERSGAGETDAPPSADESTEAAAA
ncbi:DUF1731 domain-containing protein [Pseudoclavibacter chungangensis]|uniref:DUF1731 domain-containing protein n=1 Tax=Pseudoclavibacter chungangensis TaxID=587635 RepID=A0A7J5BSW3_9MICO|nr:DUF1731 domain-containing protein [Pseudoclavibacter chungangensis]KAB1656272.1 DUF1731 domain-containing protein [Pseudoclavibacter chungangensis]NYJ67030.1 hypothetical protein [Pseudoclavibacter chungangensis]